ncbi:MAG: glutaredoxin domain-containing protein [Candidatus Aenigmatarchaeota archaeon]
MVKVRIYSTPACPWCHVAKNYFKKLGIEAEEIDVSKDENAAREMIERSGQTGVPVIEIDGEIILGFNQKEIDRALESSKRK